MFNTLLNTEVMKIKYILPIIFAFLLAACFDDDTTTGTQPISVISIDTTKLEKVYNINKFETRIITPEITQTDSSLPLSYEWQVDYKFYSDSVAFRFTGKDLGSYEVRLKVSNQDGSTFYTFQLNVNSPYEEGIAMLSEGPQGQTELSFMRKYSDEELKAGIKEKFVMNCLQLNNPRRIWLKEERNYLSVARIIPLYMLSIQRLSNWKMPSQLRNTRILFH